MRRIATACALAALCQGAVAETLTVGPVTMTAKTPSSMTREVDSTEAGLRVVSFSDRGRGRSATLSVAVMEETDVVIFAELSEDLKKACRSGFLVSWTQGPIPSSTRTCRTNDRGLAQAERTLIFHNGTARATVGVVDASATGKNPAEALSHLEALISEIAPSMTVAGSPAKGK